MTDNSRQALVGAIGGTYISLAVVDIDELTISHFALLNSSAFKSPMEAIERYIKSIPRTPRMVALSIAGTVEQDVATMTHLPWKPFDWNDTLTGHDGTDPVATDALERMATWLGRFAGDMALHYGASGGVYLAGGLPTGLVETLKKGRFRAAFDGVGEREQYLKNVAVYALKPAADPGLRGAAVALANSLPEPKRNYRQVRA